MHPTAEQRTGGGLDILIVASEVEPFAKVGGLADVVSGLSSALRSFGHDVRIVMPRYGSIDLQRFDARTCLEPMGVWMGDAEEWCSVLEAEGVGRVPVYFIEHQLFFNREGIYHDDAMRDYGDNPRRFGFLSRAALQLCKDIGFTPDLIHAHDWQTALVPAYLKLWHWNDRLLGSVASVLTVHNISHQGVYPKMHLPYLGLGWHNFTSDKFESYDRINLLKGGIFYADGITTVSPTHAREITAPFGGFGLAPYLSARGPCFNGVTNGIDYSVWNPQTDPLIPARFSEDSLDGKKECKRSLQAAFNLQQHDRIALIGVIGRFVVQKGFELIARTLERVVENMVVQIVILGSGEGHFESYFGDLPRRYSGRIGSFIGFDNQRAHLIEAGCDFFLMPSLFEPCGLTQMYSQRYGALPIVRATGGLDDTVEQYDESTGQGTGFKFRDPTEDALYYTVGWAISTWYDRPRHISAMMRRAMKRDFSWQRRAREYEAVYRRAIARKKERDKDNRPFYR